MRQGRRRLDLTQHAFASEVGCTESMLKKIEAGVRTPSPPLQARFELLLGAPSEGIVVPNPSTELHTVIVVDAASVAIAEACLRDRRAPGIGTDALTMKAVSVSSSAMVIAVRDPRLARSFSHVLMQRGARRVFIHSGIDGAERTLTDAVDLHRVADDGRDESPAVAMLLGAEIACAAESGDIPETRFVNTGVVPRRPRQLTGRDELVDRIAVKIADRTDRFITVTGPGGVGKSVLALAAIEAAHAKRPSPVVCIDLSVAADPDDAAELVRAALANISTDIDGPSWSDRLRQWTGVVFVDSAEHVRSVASLLEEFIEVTPASVVVTSRMRLDTHAETEVLVGPLATASPVGGRSDAATLFCQRAGFSEEGTHGAADAIEELCARLDGLPLAIELAAARTRQLPVSAMSQHIAMRVADLSDTSPGLAPRHRTLRATIEWSLSLLHPTTLLAARRLAVVEGAFDFDAITRIGLRWPDSRMNPDIVIDELVANNLVFRTDDRRPRGRFNADVASEEDAGNGHRDADEAPTWRMFSTLREVLKTHLDLATDRQARADHAAWTFDAVERLAPELYGPGQQHAFDRLRQSLPDLRRSIAWSIEAGDPNSCAQVVSALQRFWTRAGLFTDARSWAARILLCELAPRTRAKLLNTTGTLAFLQGESLDALGPLESSRVLFAEVGDERGEADALANLGVCFGQLGRHETGIAHTEKSLELRRRIGDQRGVGISLGNLGQFASLRGDRASGRRFLGESVEVHRQIDDGYLLVEALQDLARIEAADDLFDRAGGRLLEALALAERLQADRIVSAVVLTMVEITTTDHLRTERCRLGARMIGAAQSARRRAGLRTPMPENAAVAHIAGSLGPKAWEIHLGEGGAFTPAELRETADRFLYRGRVARNPHGFEALQLSARELRVLRLLGDGATNKDIARELEIRPSTVASHVRTVFSKLGVTSRAAAVAVASERGLR